MENEIEKKVNNYIDGAVLDIINGLVQEATGRKIYEQVFEENGELLLERLCDTPEKISEVLAKGKQFYRIEAGKVNVQAAQILLDRRFGKASQSLTTKDKDGNIQPITGINYILPEGVGNTNENNTETNT